MMSNAEFNALRARVGRRYDQRIWVSSETYARSFRFWAWFPRRW